ncbi:MAG TPA: MIP/aquaporin family protein [Candidatus Limnocylindria bacterium]|nr:MIP/aquaporin family protein [Candidatus Limnocylindria bacterium]
MDIFLGELIGTGLLILLGDGVVAGVLLARSKAENAGWIVITLAWGLAVYVGVVAAGPVTGAHLNPAVTIALAVNGVTPWADVPVYLAGEFAGAFIGAVLVYLHYLPHWGVTENADLKLAVFSTGPAIRNTTWNLVSEVIGTFVLVFVVLLFGNMGDSAGLAALGALPVALLVVGIGLSLGGTTGYAINPARDLGPRIAHFLLPIPGKRDSDWGYSWIPVVGPIIGGVIAAVAANALFTNYLMA